MKTIVWPILLGLSFAAIGSCNQVPAKTVEQELDVSDALCTELESQELPEFVTFACTAVSVADQISRTFRMRVRKEDAAAFRLRRCAAGAVSP